MGDSLNKRVVSATKWSAITEVAAKLVTPITSIVLAHILVPEAFGIVATLTMIISFAEIFTDAGFQKYLIQHDFIDDCDQEQSTTVAFWSNLVLSVVIWLIIAVFAEPLASFVGNPGLGNVLIIACISIPISAFSSIQIALFKRDLDFKTLFKARLIGICIPIIVTIPLALILKSFWALIIGTIVQNSVNAVVLTLFSKWRPSFYYSLSKFREMLSFTVWSLFESVSIWLTNYFDVFIVGRLLSQYYLGLYKTASTVVGQIMGLVTATTTPILFSALAKLQNNRSGFEELFFKFQKYVGILIIPLGVGIFCYSELITSILLGEQWKEASGFVGLWGLTSALTIVLAHYSSEVYRSLGKPNLSVLAQWLHIIVLWPTILISSRYGFHTLYVSRSLVRLELVLVHLIIMERVIGVSIWKMLSNISPMCLSSIVMFLCHLMLSNVSDSTVWQLFSILCCSVVYFLVLMLFKNERRIIINEMTRLLSMRVSK